MNKFVPIGLKYRFDALEPYIDEKTMEIHSTKHHQTYADKLNGIVEKQPELFDKDVKWIVENLDKVKEEIRQGVRNNAGGVLNHNMFWEFMTGEAKNRELKGKVVDAINKTFGDFDKFQKAFTDAALNRFGSGWAWLVVNKGKLEIVSTGNQDNPLTDGKIPILGIDVWEHAYYLKYMNKRVEYVQNWFNVIDWKKIDQLYSKSL